MSPLALRRPYRYAYGVCAPSRPTPWANGLAKLDLGDPSASSAPGPAKVWSAAPGGLPSEPIFVPRPGAAGGRISREDDGVVLSVVSDGAKGSAFLVVLDAATLTELARAEATFQLPASFHGHWFSS